MSLSMQYLAGLFDGEGWISVKKFKNKKSNDDIYYKPCLGIHMNGFDLLKKIHDKFGGRLHKRKNFINRPTTEWVLSGAYRVLKVLKILYPYLNIKKKQAKLCMLLCKTYGIRKGPTGSYKKRYIKLPQYIIEKRQKFLTQIKAEKLMVQ